MHRELQGYLDSKKFNDVFTCLVEQLLTDRPENPIAAMVEHLYERYPDAAKAARIG